ncbi:MAG: acylneuraminate cytidylyltransferase family protein [Proteobacteria bacterium]|nr:acylneuraminate cytidylyltransferase family protein [Pseudomonadota bacterium]MBU2620673.1 acylneuraminate cytidylyltransferase family protein [Pseudomonadota bacterium]
MINGHTVLALITARGGSKGLPRKNIRDLGGKPLLAWTAEAAKRSRYIDQVVLSSDDQEIIKIGLQYGCECPFIRPAELASDEASTMDAVHHALAAVGNNYEYIVLLQPTSPFRSEEDIDNCLELCLSLNAPACVSVTECEKNPYWMYSVTEHSRMEPLIPVTNRPQRRQELPKAFVLNGAIYVAQSEWLSKQDSFVQNETVACVMPQERSLDIDTLQDFQRAQFLLEKENHHGSDTAKIHRLC